jgi:hypothetical protein
LKKKRLLRSLQPPHRDFTSPFIPLVEFDFIPVVV